MMSRPSPPPGWKATRLRFVARLNPSKSEVDLPEHEEVSFLAMEAIGEDGSIRLDATRPISEVQSGYSYFRDGDVAVAKITPCFENGKGALMRGLVGGMGFGTTELIVVRPDPQCITPAFLSRLFQSPEFRALGEGSMYGAGGQKRVPDEFVRNFTFALPPISEQTAITTFLDRETGKIDALVGEQKRLIELLKEKRQAVISHAVTKGLNPNARMKPSGVEWLGDVPEHWQVTKLGRFWRLQGGYAFSSSSFGDEGIPVVRMNNLNRGALELSHATMIPYEDGNDSVALQAGDLVWGMSGSVGETGSLGNFARVTDGDLPCQLNQRVGRFVPQMVEARLDWLEWLIQGRSFYQQVLLFVTGTAQFNVSSEQVQSCLIALPPPSEMDAIAVHLRSVMVHLSALSSEAERAIALLLERRSALISAAVTGKIEVRDIIKQEEAA